MATSCVWATTQGEIINPVRDDRGGLEQLGGGFHAKSSWLASLQRRRIAAMRVHRASRHGTMRGRPMPTLVSLSHPWINATRAPIYGTNFPREATDEEVMLFCRA